MSVHTVVVALDGSAVAETALEPATHLARALGAGLHLVRATWHRPPVDEAAYLDAVAGRLAVEGTRTSTPIGFAANEVVEVLGADDEPLLCLATRGHHGVGDLVVGSVATDILRRTQRPVLLVGPGCRPGALAGSGPIVLAYDDAPVARGLEPLVTEWARALERPVRIVTARHRNGEYLGDQPAAPVLEAAAALAARLVGAGVAAESVALDGVDPARAIAADADTAAACLLVAGARSDGPTSMAARLSRAVLGSTAERLVRRAAAPVLVALG